MTKRYEHAVSGLSKKALGVAGGCGNAPSATGGVCTALVSIDHVLRSPGFTEDLDAPRSNRVVYFHRNELHTSLIDELRNAKAPLNSRDRDSRIDLVKRAGKSLKLLREQDIAVSAARWSELAWSLAQEKARREPGRWLRAERPSAEPWG